MAASRTYGIVRREKYNARPAALTTTFTTFGIVIFRRVCQMAWRRWTSPRARKRARHRVNDRRVNQRLVALDVDDGVAGAVCAPPPRCGPCRWHGPARSFPPGKNSAPPPKSACRPWPRSLRPATGPAGSARRHAESASCRRCGPAVCRETGWNHNGPGMMPMIFIASSVRREPKMQNPKCKLAGCVSRGRQGATPAEPSSPPRSPRHPSHASHASHSAAPPKPPPNGRQTGLQGKLFSIL